MTKDGVTVAKEITLSDPYESMGAQMVKEAASRTSDIAGDGTTTATVLAEAIYREGIKSVAAGSNPIFLKRGIDRAVEAAVLELARMSKPVADNQEIRQVATISANGDEGIGQIIEAIGARIARRVLDAPIRALCSNAGVEGSVIGAQMASGSGSFGYNVATGEFEDLLQSGVIDPTKVTRAALQNAASIAGLLLTTECMIVELSGTVDSSARPRSIGTES